ncbi:hypothetical protein Tco_1289963, partial [Tanacetum coccineum]
VPLEEIEIEENLRFIEEPIEIVEQDVKKLKRRRIPLVKVRWNSRQGAEYTWEREDLSLTQGLKGVVSEGEAAGDIRRRLCVFFNTMQLFNFKFPMSSFETVKLLCNKCMLKLYDAFNAPNAPSKTPSTKGTLSSSIDYTPKSPTSSTPPSTNVYLNLPTSLPSRVPLPPPTQENTSMDITLTLSPITPLNV